MSKGTLYSALTKTEASDSEGDTAYEEQLQELRDQLFRRAWDTDPQLLRNQDDVRCLLRDLVTEEGLSPALIDVLVKDIYGFGPISELMSDPLVTDIWIDRFNLIYYERDGKVCRWKKRFPSEDALRRFAFRLASSTGRKIDEARPVEDFRLSDGSRVVVFLSGVSVRGTSMAIRRFPRLFTLQELSDLSMFPTEIIRLLQLIVKARINVFTAGGMGSGKNTLLYAMLLNVGPDEKLVFVEDPAESKVGLADPDRPGLPLPRSVVYEPRRSGVEGEGEVPMALLFEKVLRTKPTRVICSECRNEVTTYWTLQAMNIGHPGSGSSIHADGLQEVPLRLSDMLAAYKGGAYNSLASRAGAVAAAELILFLGQINGHRRLLDIAEVRRKSVDALPVVVPLYRYDVEGFGEHGAPIGALAKTGEIPSFMEKRKLSLYLTPAEKEELRRYFC